MMSEDQTLQPVSEPIPPMLPEFRISDLDTLRIVADPTRISILELLVMDAMPVKRLAKTLQLPQTKLYYHINQLEEHGMIRVVATRVVSGIIEKHYRATAQSYRLDESLLALNGPDRSDTVDLMLGSMLNGLRNDLQRGFAGGLIDTREDADSERRLTFARAPLRLSPQRAKELHKRLADLIEQFCGDATEPNSHHYQLFIAYFPTYATETTGGTANEEE